MESKRFDVGTLLAHFRILSWIGAGGMGDVYLAEDTRLGRKVALKVLPSAIASDPARVARFELEGRAASALNHPNILTVFDIGRSGDHYFIASELIDGVTVREQLSRGPMKLPDVLDVAIQIASALAAAHGDGIVHRDIKPENIMIRRDGYVKVLDFGLAKLTDATSDGNSVDGATVHRATEPGTVLGTVNYMSPEQTQGESVDARSDIFSVGVVLYEMITGKVPFEGSTRSHVIVSILERNPLPLESVAGIPHELHRIVHKTLEKSRDERYQVIKDLLLDLKALRKELEQSSSVERDVSSAYQPAISIAPGSRTSDSSQANESSPRTVSSVEYIVSGISKHKKGFAISAALLLLFIIGAMVLPMFTREVESGQRIPIAVADFDNQTGDVELNALSGMLITSLEQSKRLAVMTRSRMFDALKGMGREGITVIDERLGREVCAREGVDALVVASIRKFGELYLVDLKVVDTTKNEYVFTAKEEGKGKESIPGMIDQLSEKLRLGLKEREHEVASTKSAVAEATTVNLEAYQLYFRGEQLIQQLKLDEAVVELRKAIALDPTFVQAQYSLAYALGWEGDPEATVIANNAVKYLDKAPLKEKLLFRAMKAENDGNIDQAMALWRQVLARYPEEKEALYMIGDYSFHLGEFAASKEHLEKVLLMDPKFTRAHQHLIWTHRGSHDIPSMVAAAERFARTESSEVAQTALLDAYTSAGRKEDALELSRRTVEQYPEGRFVRVRRMSVLQFFGESERAREEIATWRRDAKSPRDQAVAICAEASLETYHGRFRRAIERFDEARTIASTAKEPIDAITYQMEKLVLMAWSGEPGPEMAAAVAATEAVAPKATNRGNLALIDAYLILGDYEKARAGIHRYIWGSKAVLARLEGEKELRAGNFGTAAAKLDEASKNGIGVRAFLALAEARLALGDNAGALAAIERCVGPQQVGDGFSGLEPWILVYPKALFMQGKIHEARGDRKAARESYSKFLALWKDADANLKEPAEARARMAKL